MVCATVKDLQQLRHAWSCPFFKIKRILILFPQNVQLNTYKICIRLIFSLVDFRYGMSFLFSCPKNVHVKASTNHLPIKTKITGLESDECVHGLLWWNDCRVDHKWSCHSCRVFKIEISWTYIYSINFFFFFIIKTDTNRTVLQE